MSDEIAQRRGPIGLNKQESPGGRHQQRYALPPPRTETIAVGEQCRITCSAVTLRTRSLIVKNLLHDLKSAIWTQKLPRSGAQAAGKMQRRQAVTEALNSTFSRIVSNSLTTVT